MKKIININLSGRVIPIEDTAYEKLQVYIESLRRYFAKEEDKDEIINDIESRIAELMSEKIRKGAQSITDADIDEIAASMGRPEDFEAQDMDSDTAAAGTSAGQSFTATAKKSRGRLYRDTNDKFLGGVCSGIAAYLNIDPAIVRILFVIIAFGSFGVGVFGYILLWILLPANDVENPLTKRLYRNPEDRVIAGVAGGLAAYFNRESWVIRLIFAAPFLLSISLGIIKGLTWNFHFGFFPNIFFGSLTTTFIFAYIILWIVLPEARSTYQKMEMRGEKVDVNSIRQNMKDRMKEWSEEVKESAQHLSDKAKQYASSGGQNFAKEVSQAGRRTGTGVGHAIGVVFKVIALVIAGIIAFSLLMFVLALILGGIAWWPANNFLWTGSEQQAYAWGTIIFFILVPLIGLVIWIIRRITGVRSRHGYLGWVFGCLWTIGWICAVLFAVSISRDFRHHEEVPENIMVTQPPAGRMLVLVSEPELQYTGRFDWMSDESEGWDLTDDTLRISAIRFNVIKSNDDLYQVVLKRRSFGRTGNDAEKRAADIRYHVVYKDSVLDLASGYAIGKDSKFRGQEVEVEIRVPAGKKINFDRTVSAKLNPVYRGFGRRVTTRVIVNDRVTYYRDDYFRFKSGVDYTMQADGTLKDNEGKVISNSTYRYNDTERTMDSNEIKRSIQEKEEELKKLKEKINKKDTPVGLRDESMDNKEEERSSYSSPVFSLVQTFF